MHSKYKIYLIVKLTKNAAMMMAQFSFNLQIFEQRFGGASLHGVYYPPILQQIKYQLQ